MRRRGHGIRKVEEHSFKGKRPKPERKQGNRQFPHWQTYAGGTPGSREWTGSGTGLYDPKAHPLGTTFSSEASSPKGSRTFPNSAMAGKHAFQKESLLVTVHMQTPANIF